VEERRSYSNFAGSAALHGAVLALILLGFASAPKFADSPEAIPIQTVSLSELNQIANGEKNAKPAPQPAPAPPEPPPDLRASVEPTPPPPAPTLTPKAEATPPPKPAPEPPKAESLPPKPVPSPKADSTPSPEPTPPERPEPTPTPTLKIAIPQAPAEPPVRPKFADAPPERPKEPAPDKPKPSHNFDPNTIAKLIGQGKTPTAAVSQTAATTPQGLPHHDAPHMSMSLASALDAWLTESYLNCWTPPPGMPDGDTYVAQIKVVFNPDGSLSGRPVLLNPPSDRAWRAHAESAMRAVRKCDPLKVPAEYMPYFEQWKIETIHFDPRETQG
jgi:outer membrane biosynthesis protein TonB